MGLKVVIDKELFDAIVSGKVKILRNKRLKYGRYRIVRVLVPKGVSSGC
ncbi:hypothetical protein QPL79_08205 [Ignisphaera sp. 4213-co]|uniref:Uncharacterized protein n=1 Tax=Ignisphaera cupida TaxID=3050454 RepID=A0ABD4Z9U8_9CREN|nr:hypothetical protein [Ignisphaera sp. 4213-co]MDK6029343.1 hypothetical protein [Ignisphaera sp. 4213-co]